jgi:HSP20 family protein
MTFGLIKKENKPSVNRRNDWFFDGLPSLFDDFFNFPDELKHSWNPSIDIKETEKTFIVEAELPGLDEKELDIKVENDILSIKGEKKEETEEKDKEGKVYFSERKYGAFERCLKLPDVVNQNEISANYKNGILKINLPKDEQKQPPKRKIEVQSENK